MSETVGERLRRLRNARGLSQRDISAVGVSYAYISRIEAGRRDPSVKALRKLAERLGVSVEYLETGTERTTTDGLLEALGTNGNAVVITASDVLASEDGVRVEFTHLGKIRHAGGATLTEALRNANDWTIALDEIERERQELEQRAVEIEQRGT